MHALSKSAPLAHRSCYRGKVQPLLSFGAPDGPSGTFSWQHCLLASLGITAAILLLGIVIGIIPVELPRLPVWLHQLLFGSDQAPQPTSTTTSLARHSSPRGAAGIYSDHQLPTHSYATSTAPPSSRQTQVAGSYELPPADTAPPATLARTRVQMSSRAPPAPDVMPVQAGEPLLASSSTKSGSIMAKALTSPSLGSKGEEAAQAALQQIFGQQFPFTKVRPPWLTNPRTGRALELDLFCADLKLGLEIDGLHHNVYPNNFHKSRDQFNDQVYRDRLKDSLCDKMGVRLVRIPFTVPRSRIEAYLRSELRVNNTDQTKPSYHPSVVHST